MCVELLAQHLTQGKHPRAVSCHRHHQHHHRHPHHHPICSINVVHHSLGFYTFSPYVLVLNKFYHKDPGHWLGAFAFYFLFAGN